MFESPPGLGPTGEGRREQQVSAKATRHRLTADGNRKEGRCHEPWLLDRQSMKAFTHAVLG
jgi:hypothetical protein